VLPLLPHPATYKTFTFGLRAALLIGFLKVLVFTVSFLLQLDLVLASSMIFLVVPRHPPP
jgi:hypothetical protein